MKLNGYEITIKNAWAYIQGVGRKTLQEINPEIFKSPPHIQEQILWRKVISNKQCNDKKMCVLPIDNPCKCKMPDKLYSDKQCEGGCYPKIMSENNWAVFKQMCARQKINIYKRNFDWETIIHQINNMEDYNYSSLISVNKSSVNLGESQEGDILKHTFELFNPFQQVLKINNIKPSCSCTSYEIKNNNVPHNEYCNIDVFINTKGLSIGQHEVWLTIRYNEINRLNLKLNYTLK